MSAQVKVIRASGEVQRFLLDRDESTVGSHARADICLQGMPLLAPRHLLLAPRADCCWVSATPGAPLVDEQGRAIAAEFMPWGSSLRIGDTELVLEAAELKHASTPPPAAKKPGNSASASSDKAAESSRESSIHPIFLLLLVLAAGLFASGLLTRSEGEAAHLSAQSPELFDEVTMCSSKNPRHRAALAEDEALARSERAAFAPQEGVQAVKLLRESAHCYRAASESLEADRVSELAADLQREIEEDARLTELRVSRALDEGNALRARPGVRRLLELYGHRRDSSYVLALRRLELRLLGTPQAE